MPSRRLTPAGSSSMLRSSAGAEWVSAPTEMKSTPVAAISATLSSVIPPDASSSRAAPPAASRSGDRGSRAARRRHVVEQQPVGARRERLRGPRRGRGTRPRPRMPGLRLARRARPPPPRPPASATWFSLIRIASSRPMRWLLRRRRRRPRPSRAPAAPASSCGCRGSSRRCPSTASTKRAVSVATPDRWPRKLSAVRSRGEQRSRRAGDERDVARARRRATRPRGASGSKLCGARLAKDLGGDVEPEEDARLPSGRSARRRPASAGTIASEVTSPAPTSSASARATRLGRARSISPRGNTAIVAVKPWRKLRPPTGPISPAQKNPPAGAPSASSTRARVVVGDVEHVRAAAVAGEQQRAGGAGRARARALWARSASRRSSSAEAPSRTCMRTVWPDPDPLAERDRRRLGIGADDRPDQEVAALVVGLVLVDHDAEHQPLRRELAARRRRASPIASRRRSIAGFEASSSITLPSRAGDRHLRADRRRALRDAGHERGRPRASRRPRRRRARRRRGRATPSPRPPRSRGRRAPACPGRSSLSVREQRLGR